MLSGLSNKAFSQFHITQKADYSSFSDHFKWIPAANNNVNELNIIAGYSANSTRGFWGKIPSASLRVFGLRYNRKIIRVNNRHTIEYVAELNVPIKYKLVDTSHHYGTGKFYGFGITPLGFQFNWRTKNTIQPFLKTSTGFMYLDRRFPDDRGTRFNFTLELGGGVEIMLGEHLSFSAGYKYHHMSNFFFGEINPGVDSNIFYTGITVF